MRAHTHTQKRAHTHTERRAHTHTQRGEHTHREESTHTHTHTYICPNNGCFRGPVKAIPEELQTCLAYRHLGPSAQRVTQPQTLVTGQERRRRISAVFSAWPCREASPH